MSDQFERLQSFIKQARDALPTIWQRFTRPASLRFFLFLIVGAGLLGYWLVWPAALHPFVRVSNGSFSIRIDCVPQQMDIEIRAPVLTVTSVRAEPTVSLGEPSIRIETKHDTFAGANRDSTVLRIDFTEMSGMATTNASRKKRDLTVFPELQGLSVVDIQKISLKEKDDRVRICAASDLEGDALFSSIAASTKRTMAYYPIQEKLSNGILAVNELIGTVVVSAMVLGLLRLVDILIRGVWGVYASSDTALRRDVALRLSIVSRSAHDANDVIEADFEKLIRRLAFARVMGPALGFALTVSSLIAGLHPAAQETQTTFRLITSLQLAMVATFVGLAIRIIAEFAIRFHLRLAEYKMTLNHANVQLPSQSDSVSGISKPDEHQYDHR